MRRLVIGLLACVIANPTMAQSIVSAAREGNLVTLETLLPSNATPDPNQMASGLYFAAQRGHESVVAFLIDRGADPNAGPNKGSPLQIAARGDHAGIVQYLLDHGADPNLTAGEYRQCPLHQAAERGALDAARLLIDAGADVNCRDRLGLPPLHFAVLKGRDAMIALLQDSGAGPNTAKPIKQSDLDGADLEAGRIRAIVCARRHQLSETDSGPVVSYAGPFLAGIIGRGIASVPDFSYSDALAEKDGTWTLEELNQFLADPTGTVPGTAMEGDRVPDHAERINLIAYLQSLN